MGLPCSTFWHYYGVDMGGDRRKEQETLHKIVGFMTDTELLKEWKNTTWIHTNTENCYSMCHQLKSSAFCPRCTFVDFVLFWGGGREFFPYTTI